MSKKLRLSTLNVSSFTTAIEGNNGLKLMGGKEDIQNVRSVDPEMTCTGCTEYRA